MAVFAGFCSETSAFEFDRFLGFATGVVFPRDDTDFLLWSSFVSSNESFKASRRDDMSFWYHAVNEFVVKISRYIQYI